MGSIYLIFNTFLLEILGVENSTVAKIANQIQQKLLNQLLLNLHFSQIIKL